MANRSKLCLRISYIAPMLLSVSAICGFGCDHRGEPHFLGHIAALTGSQRERGQQAMRGVQLAVEEINADPEQLVAGRKITVLHADGRGDAEMTAAQAMRLVK